MISQSRLFRLHQFVAQWLSDMHGKERGNEQFTAHTVSYSKRLHYKHDLLGQFRPPLNNTFLIGKLNVTPGKAKEAVFDRFHSEYVEKCKF